MDKEELFKMLDLGARSKPAREEPLATQSEESLDLAQEGEGATFSESALVLDKWDLERGQLLLDKSPSLKKAKMDPLAAADFHAAAFQTDPELVELCSDSRRHQFLKTLLETAEYKALHTTTMLNSMASEMAACQFGESFAALKEKDEQRRKCNRPGKPGGAARTGEQADLNAAVAVALEKATKDVEDVQDMTNALGCGPGQGSSAPLSGQQVAQLFKRVRNSRALKRITELAGRYRLCAQAKQRQKVIHGRDEVVGVELDGDISRLIPAELAALGHPLLKMDAMRRLVERQMMCREFRGEEKLAKGPIVVCVDESGSMNGEPLYSAKAFALAMAWIANQQKRWCCLIGFSDGVHGSRCILKPGQWNQDELLQWLEHNFSGGTSLHVPCQTVPSWWQEMGCPKGTCDEIIITDGIVGLPEDVKQSFLKWKAQEQVKVHSLIINCEPGRLTEVSDEVHRIRSVSLNETGIQNCLSI